MLGVEMMAELEVVWVAVAVAVVVVVGVQCHCYWCYCLSCGCLVMAKKLGFHGFYERLLIPFLCFSLFAPEFLRGKYKREKL